MCHSKNSPSGDGEGDVAKVTDGVGGRVGVGTVVLTSENIVVLRASNFIEDLRSKSTFTSSLLPLTYYFKNPERLCGGF